jgi:hypothetical protein
MAAGAENGTQIPTESTCRTMLRLAYEESFQVKMIQRTVVRAPSNPGDEASAR